MIRQNLHYLISVSAIIILGIVFISFNKNIAHINKLTSDLSNSITFNEYLHSTETTVNLNKARIIINYDTKEPYDHLDTVEQFSLLEYYTKQLKYFLRNTKNSLLPYISEIHLISDKGKYPFKFINEIKNHKSGTNSNSILYMNDQKIYTSGLLKHQIKMYRNNHPEEKKDLEILNYAYNLYRTLTQNGKYYNPTSDSKIILKNVSQKFNITFEEYEYIYKKYALGFADISL
ncbi:hypothetical protein [Bacillus sp. 1P06AnD]|uniref:hypothetical protein n=1 Tax=Bacillus sp. 1P06AnD TaxID=3132208 RepID=UPI0039A1BE59